ncbi:pyridoxal phosphate-dependent decarboxylase family protein [Streptomyces nigra]|uniref:pyridoxal phosphate-dependent decarboxylase family protein n=1 Tax=Streptomyces nigra TaxID=1827580 RepID=UPI003723347C
MRRTDWKRVVDTASAAALEHLESLPDRPVLPAAADHEAILSLLDRPPGPDGIDAVQVIGDLARDMRPYITAQAGGRYFGFVVGGLHPAALGAELLVSAWDQNAPMFAATPGVAVAEELAARWFVDLVGLPAHSSVGFVTGGQMATFTCLAAARHELLREVGWDVEARGLSGAPPLTVVVKTGVHATVPRALRLLGLGEQALISVGCDDEDRMRPDLLEEALASIDGPTIVVVESGNVNTGSFDHFEAVADIADAHRAAGNPTWVHVDGAVMLLAAAAPSMAGKITGLDRLDSWSTDGHKLLNVAYDCGIAICRNAAAHRAAMSVTAAYLEQDTGARDPLDWGPDFSRRARGVQVYATLRALGRDGVIELVERTTSLARRFAHALRASGYAEIVNDVVSNQVLVRWPSPDGDHARLTEAIMAGVRAEGTAFFTGTTYRGERLMRISVSDWATDTDDVDRAVDALLRHARFNIG